MAVQKSLLASLKHIVPSDLEYYLEEKNAEGLKLLPLGQGSLFFLQFSEETPQRYRYVVDCPTMQKVSYMKRLTEEGWELMGSSFSFYIWRKHYEEGQRPEDFADKAGQRSHCLRLGIILLIFALAFVGLFGAMIWSLRREYLLMGMAAGRMACYILIIALQLPFIFLFGRAAYRLLKEVSALSRKMELETLKRRSKAAVKEEDEGELSFSTPEPEEEG
ncbi:MAG: DUF2812 domain-containing protein [Lachnospiraceae bacterium]|nr:DUF2812 domain-containing protein [Lachnospiraceae bacterium]